MCTLGTTIDVMWRRCLCVRDGRGWVGERRDLLLLIEKCNLRNKVGLLLMPMLPLIRNSMLRIIIVCVKSA